MAKDVVYTNGVIAARETHLLGGKIFKLCESGADDAFRAVTESGFGKGAEAPSVYDYEKLLAADERDLDAFVREYAPTNAEKAYFLAPRDFHNAKAVIKAHYLNTGEEKMLAPEGLVAVDDIKRCVQEGDFSSLGGELAAVCGKVFALLSEESGKQPDGAEIGAAFEGALYRHLLSVCGKNRLLKKLIIKKSDMTDIMTALRSKTPEYAADNFIRAGKLKDSELAALAEAEGEYAERVAVNPEYADFLKMCLEDKAKGLPFTREELLRDNLETSYLAEKRYELKNTQPFLYYVFRRRAENANLRILFVCLIAGMGEGDIKRRLRSV